MTDKNSSKSRRKLLKSIAAGSGAVIAGKSLPENWTKPVVDSVTLPAHAQATGDIPPPETCSTINIAFNFTATGIDNGGVGYDIYPAGGGNSIDGAGVTFNVPDDTVNTTYSHTYAPGQYLVYAAVGGAPGSGSITGTGTVTCCTGDSETILDVALTGTGVGQTGCVLVTIATNGTCMVEPSNNCPVNCLAYETPILTAGNKYRTIKSLKVGDMVKAIDQDMSSILTVVTKVITHHLRNDFYTINGDLRITDDHPVLVSRGEFLTWCRVDSLSVGDRVRSLDGFVDVDSIEYHDESLETVYVETQCGNFIAKGGSNHYVVKSTYAEDSQRLLKGELKAFA